MQASKKSDIFFGATCKNEALTFLVGVSFFITEIAFEFAVSGYEADERGSPSEVASAPCG